jgi:ubiquinone/menaquinone biosynthesis C-methylase UbiE
METTKTNITFGGSIPKIYDDVLGPVYFEPYAVDMAEKAAALNPKNILEIACGTGRVTAHLVQKLPAAKLIASDINPDMIAIAKTKVGEAMVNWQQADGTQLPFEDNSFDLVLIQFGIMFYPDKLKGLQEVFRVLKKDGTLLFNVWDSIDHNHFSRTGREIVMQFFDSDPPAFYNIPYSMGDAQATVALLEEAGFNDIKYQVSNKESICVSADVMSMGLVEGNPIVNAIRERDSSAIPVLRAKVKETLIERFGDNPCTSTMQAIIFSAKK